jgi:acyl-homoserine-lactone acylase
MLRRLAMPLVLAVLAGCAASRPSVEGAPRGPDPAVQPEWAVLADHAEVRRTHYGVPHILADNLKAAGFALAWVQLEDHGARIVAGLIEARGETARYLDGEAADLDGDFLARRRHDRALETFPLLPADVRDVYDGFAAAVNRYVGLHPDEFTVPPPVFTGADVSARDVVEPSWVVGRRFASRAERGEPLVAAWASGGEEAWIAEDPEARLAGWEPGSNTWAFAPSRTTSGRAILMRNPHLSWAAGYYEAHVTVPGVLNFYGDFRLGGPFGMIGGFNERLGWSSTNNAPRLNDLYALELDPARPDYYRFDGRSRPLERVAVTLEYRREGALATETRERWETHLGPVIHRDADHAYVLRTGGEGNYRVGEQFLRMMTATSLDEWRDAMRIQARNGSNFTYADADGNIFYVWSAAHPARPHDHAGDTLAIPARGAADVWTDIIPFDALPQLLNPPGGYLRNENDPFHHTNLNAILGPADFPPEFPEPRVRLRSQHSLELVHGDHVLSLEDVWEAKHSERMLLADRVKDNLMAALAAAAPTGEVAAAARLLREWDNTVAADARGAVLFAEWWNRYLMGGVPAQGSPASAGLPATAESLFREPWRLDAPATTPRGLADPARAVAAFQRAVPATRQRWGAWDVAWGDVHRARVGKLDLPVGGCDGLLGCFRVIWFSEDEDGRRRVRGGDGWVSAVEFTDPPRAYTVLAYGQSSREGHPHSEDQLALFVENGKKAIAFTEADIEASLIRRYRPGLARWDAVSDAGVPHDLLFRNARVYDGAGGPPTWADVAVRGERISAVGDLADAVARDTLDLTGLHLAPGFIDSHSHAAVGLATDSLSDARPLLAQGVTTVIVNPDGRGAVDLPGQAQCLLAHGLGVNVAQLVPHGSVRQTVLGMADRAPDAAELDRMRELIRAGMEAGAVGLSSGPYYAPGSYAGTDELVALARVVAEYGGVHQSHIRDEGQFGVGLLAAVDELIDVSRRSDVTGVVTHIKALGPRVWGQAEAVVDRIEAARAEGLEIYADQYPYDASSTSLSGALVPRWALAGGRDSLQARMGDGEGRQRLAADMAANLEGRGGPERIQFRRFPPDPSVEGRTLAAVAAERGQDPVEVALDLLEAGGAGVVSFNMHDDDVVRFMRQSWTMTASDGDLVEMGTGVPHPRAYGTFPRRLARYTVERGVTDVPTAIRSMTGLPAAVYGLADRGLVREGMAADLVVFDLDRVHDPATYADPHHYARGMVHVLVNGRFAIRDGQFTGTRPGEILRR